MHTAPNTLDGKSLAIGILSVTACVLFVGLLIITMLPRQAYATGQLDSSGDYKMLTQQISNTNEMVIVIDAASRQMSAYRYDFNRRELQIVQLNIPLDRLPGAAGRPGGRP